MGFESCMPTGGVYFTLADFAFAVAANWKIMGVVSLCSTIDFLSSAKGDLLTAEARCIKDGKTTCFYEISEYDGLGKLVAKVSITGYKVNKS